MEYLNSFNEFLNEGKITKISDEELVDAYKRSYEGDKNKLDVFAKELKKRGMTEYLKESVNEATSISTWTDKEVQDVWRQLHNKSGNAYKRFKQEMEKRGLPLDESNINEAQKYDIEAAVKDIREFNRNKKASIDDLAMSILKNLGFKTDRKHMYDVVDHLDASTDDDGKIPEDKDLIGELYMILK